MKTPSALLLAGTLLVAGSAALLARVLLNPPPPPPPVAEKPGEVEAPKPAYPHVLIASRDLRPGDFIDTSAVEWKASDTEVDHRLYFTLGDDAVGQLTGASVRHPVAAGTALTNALVVKPNEPGFVATVIAPGMRAITIPTNQVASQYSMLTSGDRVDVMVNLERANETDTSLLQNGDLMQTLVRHTEKETPDQRMQMIRQVLGITGQSAVPRLASQTLLQNVRVLSLNNRVRSPLQQRPEESEKSRNNADDYAYSSAETVTLEVPPVYAERLALASQIGTLQLALRSSQDSADDQVHPGSVKVTTLAQTTSVYNATSPARQPFERAPSTRTFRGDTASTVYFDDYK